jgi:hypothetical protein
MERLPSPNTGCVCLFCLSMLIEGLEVIVIRPGTLTVATGSFEGRFCRVCLVVWLAFHANTQIFSQTLSMTFIVAARGC